MVMKIALDVGDEVVYIDDMNFIVSIGRNVKSVPMDITRWQEFQTVVMNACKEYAEQVVFSGCGVGSWEGNTEESFTVIATRKYAKSWATSVMNYESLKQDLAMAAHRFGQDSIALTCGDPEFVSGRF